MSIMIAPTVPDLQINAVAHVGGGTLQQHRECRLSVCEINTTWPRGINGDVCYIHSAYTLGKAQSLEAIHD